MQKISAAAFNDTKPHYELLDGLRGVAALVVIWYHVFEGFATSPIDQRFNHGYLAVDFFFILSGFVIGYAYDDRWGRTLNIRSFFKRRLIRLHPMVVLGVLLGAITFLIQGSVQWNGTHVAFSMMLLAMLLNLFLIPAVPGTGPEVRGNGEMYPLNGPNWSLFFEYIGNIAYALFLRRLSTKALAVFVAAAGIGLATFAIGNFSGFGHIGVLMSRIIKPANIRGSFWICTLSIIFLLSLPHLGGSQAPWINGIYDSICTLLLFPLILYVGASGKATDKYTSRICKFLGDISYPVYVVHYPFMYLFYAWLWSGEKIEFSQAWPIALLLFFGNILLAYAALKLYDEPVRRWLTKKFMPKRK